jgi:TfoX/Sxy family transcriptional regulator of competence genes
MDDDEARDSIYYLQLARVARLKADATDDPDLARRLREAAIRHERKARQIRTATEATANK